MKKIDDINDKDIDGGFFSDKQHRSLGLQKDYQEVRVPGVKLPENNNPQHEAIKTALTHSVSLIQGPPGEWILAHFKKINGCSSFFRGYKNKEPSMASNVQFIKTLLVYTYNYHY